MDNILNKVIPFSTPLCLKANAMNSAQKISSLDDMFFYGEDEQAVTVLCYHVTAATAPTESLNWHQEYTKDADMRIIVDVLVLHKPQHVPQDITQSIKAPYRSLVRQVSCIYSTIG